jgi:nicotinamidase-related amidase
MPGGSSAFSDANDPLSAICSEIGPVDDELVFVKRDASTFAQRDAAALLTARDIEWLFIAGVWTEACVAATVKDAIALGFHVILVKDACGSGSVAMHETAILNIANRLYGGAVVDTDRACRMMVGATVEAWMVEGSVPLRFTYANAADLFRDL